MEEIKVNEYVRTKQGDIGKYVIRQDINFVETNNGFIGFDIENDIVKHSPNIIDLIEVGDYVNGIEVINIYEKGQECFLGHCNEKTIELKNDIYETIPSEYLITNEQIKEVVTKEQFNQIKYEV